MIEFATAVDAKARDKKTKSGNLQLFDLSIER